MIKLYYAPDNASLVVRIVLEELGVPYETRLVNRATREQEGEAYRRLNPNGLIPVCVIGGKPVAETGAILLALAERYGDLAPAQGDPLRPRFLQWLFFISNTLHADLRQLFYPAKFVGDDEAAMRVFHDMTRARVQRDFGLLDAEYADRRGPFLCGADPCIADVYAALCVRWAQLYPVGATERFDLSATTALGAMAEALETRPAVARACEAEGIAAPFFSVPTHANPPEGSAM